MCSIAIIFTTLLGLLVLIGLAILIGAFIPFIVAFAGDSPNSSPIQFLIVLFFVLLIVLFFIGTAFYSVLLSFKNCV